VEGDIRNILDSGDWSRTKTMVAEEATLAAVRNGQQQVFLLQDRSSFSFYKSTNSRGSMWFSSILRKQPVCVVKSGTVTCLTTSWSAVCCDYMKLAQPNSETQCRNQQASETISRLTGTTAQVLEISNSFIDLVEEVNSMASCLWRTHATDVRLAELFH
jgi:hypothetical protein